MQTLEVLPKEDLAQLKMQLLMEIEKLLEVKLKAISNTNGRHFILPLSHQSDLITHVVNFMNV